MDETSKDIGPALPEIVTEIPWWIWAQEKNHIPDAVWAKEQQLDNVILIHRAAARGEKARKAATQ